MRARTRFATAAVHGAWDPKGLGAGMVPPIDLSTTYRLPIGPDGPALMDGWVAGEELDGSPIYARLHNPTVAAFERGLARLEGADGAVAFASGMAAMTAVLLAARVAGQGNHVVAVRPLYGGTDHLLSSGLLGLRITWATPEAVAEAIEADTVLVIAETPGNPTLDLVDIEALVRDAGDVPVLIDSTFATPVLQNPIAHGATLVLHSATKFIGGHSDALGGVVAGPDAWVRRLRQVRIATGAVLHPQAGYLLHRGLATLPTRVLTQQRSAMTLAERLRAHPDVLEVRYPGLAANAGHAGIVARQMRGPGTMIAFRVRGGSAAAQGLLGGLRVITPAVSLGSVETLIQVPADFTHRAMDADDRAAAGIPDDLLRLSVGLEDVEDLWADLAAGLEAAREVGVDRAERVLAGV
ncbi:MAG: aminotransferase class I/II-fold pyridoxal phosphate-dependent enzyme [Gemmatimonadota bacterium]